MAQLQVAVLFPAISLHAGTFSESLIAFEDVRSQFVVLLGHFLLDCCKTCLIYNIIQLLLLQAHVFVDQDVL